MLKVRVSDDLRAERLFGTHGKRQGVPSHKPIQALKE